MSVNINHYKNRFRCSLSAENGDDLIKFNEMKKES